MRRPAKQAFVWLLAIAAPALLASRARAQESAVLVICAEGGGCACQRVYTATLQGKDTAKTVPVAAMKDPQALRRAGSVRLNSPLAVYREPQSGLLRLVTRGWQLAEIVVPSKLPSGANNPTAALAGAGLEYRRQPKDKARFTVPVSQFVALLNGPRPSASVVDFLKAAIAASEPHPRQAELINAGVAFAADSDELKIWRADLKGTMRRSLDTFRSGGVDPTRLEATLVEGLAAMRVYRMVALDTDKAEDLQAELTAEHRRLLDRFAVAAAFRNAGMHDEFLEEVGQVGLARWSRADIAAAVGPALQASTRQHVQLATELFKAKRFAQAFDEFRIAYGRSPCDQKIAGDYNNARVEFVSRSAVQALPEYDKENRNLLQQIVRDLQDLGPATITPERREYARKRIADGEAYDAQYLPLQFKKAEFLANVGELAQARSVVTEVERKVILDRAEADRWLSLDGRIARDLAAVAQRTEKTANEQMRNEQYKEALETAKSGLAADPANLQLLYLAAVAAAVQRDQAQARQYVERYLSATTLSCADAKTGDIEQTLLELYRAEVPQLAAARPEGTVPNWMSGQPYYPGEVYYDPLSGSFQPHMQASLMADKGATVRSTEFRWEGFRAVALTSTVNQTPGEMFRRERPVLTLEPVYDEKRVYMKAIGTAANSAGVRRVTPLKYLNCPDFDPHLAARFTGKVTTRGWAGNPFFHPFLWNEIYLFELEYDDLGRIQKATPVPEDSSRPSSQFSEALAFTWDGKSKRLLKIEGKKYRRVLEYDDRGRLQQEKITYPDGEGRIEYEYDGRSMQPLRAICEDNFYDKGRRTVTFETRER